MSVPQPTFPPVTIKFVQEIAPNRDARFADLFVDGNKQLLTFMIAHESRNTGSPKKTLQLLDNSYVCSVVLNFANIDAIPKCTLVSRWCILDEYYIYCPRGSEYIITVSEMRVGPPSITLAALGNWTARTDYGKSVLGKRIKDISPHFIRGPTSGLDTVEDTESLTYRPPAPPKKQRNMQYVSWLHPTQSPISDDEFDHPEDASCAVAVTTPSVPKTEAPKVRNFFDDVHSSEPVYCLGDPELRLAAKRVFTTRMQALVYNLSPWEWKMSRKDPPLPYASAEAILLGINSTTCRLRVIVYGATDADEDALEPIRAKLRHGRMITWQNAGVEEAKGYVERQLYMWVILFIFNFNPKTPELEPTSRIVITDAEDPTLINYSEDDVSDILRRTNIAGSGYRTMSMIWNPREHRDVPASVLKVTRTRMLCVRSMLGKMNNGDVFFCGQGMPGDKIMDPVTKTARYGVIPFKMTGEGAAELYDTVTHNKEQKILTLLTFNNAKLAFSVDQGAYLMTQSIVLTPIRTPDDVPNGLSLPLATVIKELAVKDWDTAGVLKERFVMFGHFAEPLTHINTIQQLHNWITTCPHGIHNLVTLQASFMPEDKTRLAYNVCAYCTGEECDRTRNLFSGSQYSGIKCKCDFCKTEYDESTVQCTWSGQWKLCDGTGVIQAQLSHAEVDFTARDAFMNSEFGVTARELFVAAFSSRPSAPEEFEALKLRQWEHVGPVYTFQLDCWVSKSGADRMYCNNIVSIERAHPSLKTARMLLRDIEATGAELDRTPKKRADNL